MRFSTWLWEQLDFPGRSGVLAKVCWDDVNNGCANARFSATDWLKHFDEKHAEKRETLADMLIPVYMEYLDEVRR
jgi:hypothetical protein